MASRSQNISPFPHLKVLMAGAESDAFKGTGASNFLPALVCPLPADTITPGSTLRFGSHVNKYGTATGGHNLKVVIAQGATEVVIAQGFINATLLFFNWDAKLTFSADRKFGFMDSVNVLNSAGGAVPAGSYSGFIAKTATSASLSARTRGPIAFATYSAPPTLETRLIDFSKPSELRFYISCLGTDTVEMKSAFAELVSTGSDFIDFASPKATLFYGHSMVEGSGATSGQDIVSLLRGLRPGRPIGNLGLGGQKFEPGSISFVDRILSDPRARARDLII